MGVFWDTFTGAIGALGAGGMFAVFVLLLLVILIAKASAAALNLFTATVRWWKHLPLWGKQTVAVVGMFFAYKFLWPTVPKTTAIVAVAVGLGMVWWAGAVHLARRYGVEMDWTGWAVWSHHLQTSAMQRGLTTAVENATTKKNGRSRRPKLTETGMETVYEPPDGMSAQELCDAINNGTLEPALARQIGWSQVNGTFAEVRGNTVALYVSAIRADGDDPLAKVRRWPGMEMT
jgi:hypothetical protein